MSKHVTKNVLEYGLAVAEAKWPPVDDKISYLKLIKKGTEGDREDHKRYDKILSACTNIIPMHTAIPEGDKVINAALDIIISIGNKSEFSAEKSINSLTDIFDKICNNLQKSNDVIAIDKINKTRDKLEDVKNGTSNRTRGTKLS